jgi:predicted branched-subunit amino acid permease
VKTLNNWKIVGNISTAFGIAFIVFAIFQAIVSYQINDYQYPTVPSSIIQILMLSDMLPYLLFAVLSLLVGGIILRTIKDTNEREDASPQPQTENQA